ncbi:MAG TPA: class I SAM-dependent methyltransferase [Eudoraea sp.]|nr:class I SAM-dependent methyltransferase [Eudoraea sp.]
MKLFLTTKDYAVTGREFQLLHDEKMDMLVTSPQPAAMEEYYDSQNYISHSNSRRDLSEKLYHFIKRYTLWRKVVLINSFGTENKFLLDVGAGTGDFLSRARYGGWKIQGVEPNPMARGKASERNVKLVEDLNACSGRKYNVITLWHVLEHLPDLDGDLNKLVGLLDKNGVLVIAVPNFKSHDARHYKNYWAGFDVPRHLWHFSKTSIERLFLKKGMEVIQIKPMIFDAYYVSLLSEKYKTGNARLLNAFYRGLRSNLSAWGTKEYSSLLYVLKKA